MNTPLAFIILSSFFIMLASLSGVIFLWKNTGTFIAKRLSLLVSFASGVFLIVVLELGQETFEHIAFGSGLLWISIGALGITLLFTFLPAFHHHHDEICEDHAHPPLDVRRIVIGDALHNIGDGILLATSFLVSPALGLTTAVSIFVHEFVQETSEFFVLRQAGFSTVRALLVNFGASLTILVGSLGGYFILDRMSNVHGPLLGITTGAFLVIVFNDLIPHSVRSSHRKKSYLEHMIWFLIGVAIMLIINKLAVHPA